MALVVQVMDQVPGYKVYLKAFTLWQGSTMALYFKYHAAFPTFHPYKDECLFPGKISVYASPTLQLVGFDHFNRYVL